jgi:hypothetical protein
MKILTWKKESYGVYNLNVSKTDIKTNHFFMYSNSIILLDNTNHNETIYVAKRFSQNNLTRRLKKFALIFDFETDSINSLNLGEYAPRFGIKGSPNYPWYLSEEEAQSHLKGLPCSGTSGNETWDFLVIRLSTIKILVLNS